MSKCNKHGPIQYLTEPGYICVKNTHTIISFNGTDTLDSEAPELYLPPSCKEGFSKIIAVGDNFSGFFKILYRDKCNKVYQNGMIPIGQNTTSVELLYTKFGWEILTGASNTHSPAFSKELIEGTVEWQSISIAFDGIFLTINDFSISNVYSKNINNVNTLVRGIVLSSQINTDFSAYQVKWIEINANTNELISTLRNDTFNVNINTNLGYNFIQLSRDGQLCGIQNNNPNSPNRINFYAPSDPNTILWTYIAKSLDYIIFAINFNSTSSKCIAILDQKILSLYDLNGKLASSFDTSAIGFTKPGRLLYNTNLGIYYRDVPNRTIVYDTSGNLIFTSPISNSVISNYVSKNGLFQQANQTNNSGIIAYDLCTIGQQFTLTHVFTKVANNSDDTDIVTISDLTQPPANIIWLHAQTFNGNNICDFTPYTTTNITLPSGLDVGQGLNPAGIDISYDGKLLMLGGTNNNTVTIYFSQLANL